MLTHASLLVSKGRKLYWWLDCCPHSASQQCCAFVQTRNDQNVELLLGSWEIVAAQKRSELKESALRSMILRKRAQVVVDVVCEETSVVRPVLQLDAGADPGPRRVEVEDADPP